MAQIDKKVTSGEIASANKLVGKYCPNKLPLVFADKYR